jgi:hypothetical protein
MLNMEHTLALFEQISLVDPMEGVIRWLVYTSIVPIKW